MVRGDTLLASLVPLLPASATIRADSSRTILEDEVLGLLLDSSRAFSGRGRDRARLMLESLGQGFAAVRPLQAALLAGFEGRKGGEATFIRPRVDIGGVCLLMKDALERACACLSRCEVVAVLRCLIRLHAARSELLPCADVGHCEACIDIACKLRADREEGMGVLEKSFESELRAAPLDTRLRFKAALGGALWSDRGANLIDEKVHLGLVEDLARFDVGSTVRLVIDTL